MRSIRARASRAAATAALAAITLSACNGKSQSGGPSATSTLTASSVTASSTMATTSPPTNPSHTRQPTQTVPTASEPSSATGTKPTAKPTHVLNREDTARQQAIAVVRRYSALQDEVSNNPRESVKALRAVLDTFLYGSTANIVQEERKAGWKSSGHGRIVSIHATKVVLPRAKGRATVVVQSCTDVSLNKSVDKAGKSVVKRPTNFLDETDTVTNSKYPSGSWLIVDTTNKFVKSC